MRRSDPVARSTGEGARREGSGALGARGSDARHRTTAGRRADGRGRSRGPRRAFSGDARRGEKTWRETLEKRDGGPCRRRSVRGAVRTRLGRRATARRHRSRCGGSRRCTSAGVSAPDEVDAGLELVHAELLHAGIVDADLRVRDTAAVPRLRVRLVLNHPVTLGGTTRHGDGRTCGVCVACCFEEGDCLVSGELFFATSVATSNARFALVKNADCDSC